MATPALPDFSPYQTIMLDVDGVLTDGSILVQNDGQQLRTMNIKDGYALQHAVKSGYRIAVISGGKSVGVKLRLEGLGLTDVFIGVGEKLPTFEAYLQQHGLQPSEVLYIGDDLPDVPIMQRVGLACAPADAATDVLNLAGYICRLPGGKGCVREVLELVMRARGDWHGPHSHVW